MDPNATLSNIQNFLANHETGEEVDHWCFDLYVWLANGGFEPDWNKAPLATSYYQCRKITHDRDTAAEREFHNYN